MLLPQPTPKQVGFSMPPEWAPHDAILLSWPHDTTSFPRLANVEQTYVEIIRTISPHELVRLFVIDETMRTHAAQLLKDGGVDLTRVQFFVHPYGDVWHRDYGPTFVVNEKTCEKAIVHWIFNAWGEKYDELLDDTKLPAVLNETLKLRRFEPGIVMEGGSIEVNGAGTVMTTEQCLLNRNRNPHLSRAEIEEYLREYLNVRHVVWLGQGIAGDDTDGHIDDIARFVNPTTVVLAVDDDPTSVNYAPLADNLERLKKAVDQDGKPFTIITLPHPHRERMGGGHLAASYTNFYIGNNVVLLPVFDDPADAVAIGKLTPLFPNRKIVPINCYDLIHGNGTLHCISQQEPSA